MKNLSFFKKLNSRRGQVAVVMILVIAIAFILYAAILNLSRVSQSKSVVTIASNLSASQLGSLMASYGESILQTSLGGRTEVKGFRQVFATILLIVLVVLIIVASLIPGMQWAAFLLAKIGGMLAAVVGVALLLVALVIQLTVVEPGMTNLWNKMMEGQLIPLDDFVERGIQAGLLSSVSDQVTVPDEDDTDLDGIYGVSSSGNANDTVGRFSLYYAERLKNIKPRGGAAIGDFFAALQEFLLLGADGWGLYDPYPITHPCGEANNESSPAKPSMCDQCCVPQYLPPGNTELVRPECCDSTDPEIPWCGSAKNSCGKRGDPSMGWADPFPPRTTPASTPGFEWLYQGLIDNPDNNEPPQSALSLREQFGRDDEAVNWEKQPWDPNGIQVFQNVPGTPFEYKDATGHYRLPWYTYPTSTKENQYGMYSLFYKLADWGPDMSPPPNLLPPVPPTCHWCDPAQAAGTAPVCDPLTQPKQIPQLALPNPLAAAPLSGGACVDQTNVSGQEKPVRPDKIGELSQFTTVNTSNTSGSSVLCADEPSNTNKPLWKRGGDQYCSKTGSWPYFAFCDKHDTCSGPSEECVCENSSNQSLWPDDTLDDMVYGMGEFIFWAKALVEAYYKNPVGFGNTILEWYPQVAYWIEPLGGYSGFGVNSPLITWMGYFGNWRDAFNQWLDTDYQGATWKDVWCYPDILERHTTANPNPAKYMPDGEYNAIYSVLKDAGNVPGVYNMDVAMACLRWNANDTIASNPPVSGNYEKFNLCADPIDCLNNWNTVCNQLPRSLLPSCSLSPANSCPSGQFNQTEFVDPSDPVKMPLVMKCLFGDPAQGGAGACSTAFCEPVIKAFLGNWATWNPAYCTTGGPWGSPLNQYFNGLAVWVTNTGGSCVDPTWLTNVRASANNAANQVAKFQKRLAFFDDGDPVTKTGVWEQARYLSQTMQTAQVKFQEFLLNGGNSPSEKLTEEVKKFGLSEPALPSQAIYAWQSEPPKSSSGGVSSRPGYWHLVRVDARIPGRCFNSCGVDPNTTPPYADPPWPNIGTRTAGVRRIYYIINRRGIVKARVTRFDEDRDPRSLVFPMGEKIWDFRFAHPGAPSVSNVNDDITRECLGQSTGLELPSPEAKGAFIIGQQLEYRNKNYLPTAQCWKTINRILRSGVVSETCAEYYLRDGKIAGYGPTGFFIKFVPCKDFE